MPHNWEPVTAPDVGLACTVVAPVPALLPALADVIALRVEEGPDDSVARANVTMVTTEIARATAEPTSKTRSLCRKATSPDGQDLGQA
jgi:hypothetical protein